MNKMKALGVWGILVVILCSSYSIVLADEPAICADLYFFSASAFLSSSKLVVFDCTLYDIYECISITAVWLEKKVNGEWEYAKALTPPSYVSLNMPDYGAEVDYSSDIGSGTFRIGFTVDADGYAITRYSNSRTFP